MTRELPLLNITTYIFNLWTYKHIHNFPKALLVFAIYKEEPIHYIKQKQCSLPLYHH
jgi:hypothetical protein